MPDRLLGTSTFYDDLGNMPHLGVLSFTPPTTPNLHYIEVYKRPTGTSGQSDVFVERSPVRNDVVGFYPYFHMLITAESDSAYVVDYLDADNTSILSASTRIATAMYEPPVAVSQRIFVNSIPYVKELVRRDYHVLETMGERAILLRKLTSGLMCECRADEAREPDPRCPQCYGVGWEGGYTPFYPFLINFQLAGERHQQTEMAILTDQQPRAWTTIVPELQNGDIVVRLHGQLLDRFEVTNPSRSVRDGVAAIPTIQEFNVRLHTQGHPIYKFPVEDFVTGYTKPTAQIGLGEKGI